MPRKTKEQKELEIESTTKKASKKVATTKATTNKSATKAKTKKVADKKVTSKKETAKKTTSKNNIAKETPTKKTSAIKKALTKKTSATKKESNKKSTATKRTPTKITRASSTKTTTKKKVEIVEYYDLPYRYNQTIVKILAQTPTNLFIYWDISDNDRKNFEKQYGENFFENTRPILIVHNNTLGYSFEIEINDFANSWYLHVADSKCDYKIELGRRPIYKNEKLNVDYIYITTSNEIESPNDRILFDINQKLVYFKNVKTGQLTGKAINSLSFIKSMGKIYNIYDLYKKIYGNENLDEFYDLTNPSSGNPSSNSFSSKFK